MLKTTAIALAAAAMLGTTAVSAQSIDLGGAGGPSIDLRSNKQRERDYQRERARDDRAYRGYDRRDMSTGSVRGGCREVTVRERDDYGNTVTRTRRDC